MEGDSTTLYENEIFQLKEGNTGNLMEGNEVRQELLKDTLGRIEFEYNKDYVEFEEA